ncbi:FecCD family ABC transporter permease [Paenibacillus marinisediminis]
MFNGDSLTKPSNDSKSKQRSRPLLASAILILGSGLLFLSIIASIHFGASDVDFKTVWQSLFSYDDTVSSHIIIRELRLPRAIAAALVGAALAVSGAIMQGMTRNPLASPDIMGVTAGSTFMMAIAFALFSGAPYTMFMLCSFVGAGLGTGLVFGITSLSKGGMSPVKLALAGSAITSLLSALSTAIGIKFNVAKEINFWYAGGVAGVQMSTIKAVLPVFIIGIGLAIILSRSITILSLGEDVAKGLGQRTGRVKLLGTITVLILTGVAVSIAGMIGFVGLVIPHVTRFLVGMDYRWIIPCSAVLGRILLVFADIVGRMINAPFETPVGAVTAIIGVPFFLYLARKDGRSL